MGTGRMSGPGTGVLAPRRNDWRARRHPGFLLAMAHRISGIALAAFLPLHFLLLGQALRGAAALDGALQVVDMVPFKIAEWLLVVLLAVHASCGLRLLVIEFRPWSGTRKNWTAAIIGVAMAVGIAFGLALVG